MFGRNPEKERQRYVDQIFDKFGYQEKVFRRGIKVKEVTPNPVIYDLGAGNCEDTIFLRKIFGSYAQIFDFDINQPPLAGLSAAALHFGNGFIQQDIRDIPGCVSATGGQLPNLVIA